MAETKQHTMKILFFVDCLVAGGKERRLVELLKGVKRKGIEFELVVMDQEIHYQEVFDLHIKIHYLIRDTKKDLSVFKNFYKICRNYRPDIVHCWDCMTAVISVPACKILKIKLVNGMVIDTPVKRNVMNKHWFRARLTFPFSNIIIGNSQAGLVAYGAPIKRSSCVYNGIDMLRFNNLRDRECVKKEIFGGDVGEVFIAGMVAAFEERKDYATMIKAAIKLSTENENIRFLLIGDGVNLKKMKGLVTPFLSNKIFFLGKKSDVESIIDIFDVGILLTNSKVHGEGISNSIVEYMAIAKPVIATSGGGTDEIVINNQNGFLIDPMNEDQLIEKIKLLMNDGDLRMKLGKRGNEMIFEKFDLKIMTANYLKIYSKLMNAKR